MTQLFNNNDDRDFFVIFLIIVDFEYFYASIKCFIYIFKIISCYLRINFFNSINFVFS